MTPFTKGITPLIESGVKGHRLINSKFPPIPLFDDVANADDFDALYELQALTNPRLQNEVGNLKLIPLADIPFGIPGCHYAAASFTHVNPDGSRFSDGSFGLMYIGDSTTTAIAEVRYHQEMYWRNVTGLNYDRFIFKELRCKFDLNLGLDASALEKGDPIYLSDDYSYSRKLGAEIKKGREYSALKYHSVRHGDGVCYALFTPKEIIEVIQSKHYEMIWDGRKISSINVISGNQSLMQY